ncbi:SAM-dependent methyltransferase, partial [Streptomyces albidoflavus]
VPRGVPGPTPVPAWSPPERGPPVPGGTLALFHPIGRAALAARQGRTVAPDDLRAEGPVTALLEAGGWRVRSYADEPERYLVLAVRTG